MYQRQYSKNFASPLSKKIIRRMAESPFEHFSPFGAVKKCTTRTTSDKSIPRQSVMRCEFSNL
jgi:hypothetical protein